MVSVLQALQAVQLTDLVGHFDGEAGEVDALLHQLGADIEGLASGSRAVMSDAGQGDGSFLTAFRARLADAADLVGTCDRARHDVRAAMVKLRAAVTDLSRIIGDLDATTRDLIVVGINAGLKAARLGIKGRSLMVIADELKRLAGLILEASSALITAYEALAQESRGLDRDEFSAVESATPTSWRSPRPWRRVIST